MRKKFQNVKKLIIAQTALPKDLLQKKLSKALGTGISNGINFNEIVILNKKSGKPYISIIGQTKKILNKKFKRKNLKFHYHYQMKNMQLLL